MTHKYPINIEKIEADVRRMLDATYQPEITDMERNEYQGVDRPVVYVDNAVKVAIRMIEASVENAIREARIDDNHDWDITTFEPVTVCRRCATTYQIRGNKPCKGKMATIGLRTSPDTTNEDKDT